MLFAIQQINRCKGDLSLLRLAEETCLCQRHFERKFKQHTGLTPKEYSRIMKFKHAVDLLRSTSFDNLLSVAIKEDIMMFPISQKKSKRCPATRQASFSLPLHWKKGL